MKKLVIVLVCAFMLVPLAAWGQKWIAPYTDKNGNFVEGHWQTPNDLRMDRYSTPGRVNPYTGQFDPYKPGVNPPQTHIPSNLAPLPTTPANPGMNPYYQQKDYRYPGD